MFTFVMWTSLHPAQICQDGEMFHEKAITFLCSLFRRWKALGVSHSLSIVLFCRCYVDDARERAYATHAESSARSRDRAPENKSR